MVMKKLFIAEVAVLLLATGGLSAVRIRFGSIWMGFTSPSKQDERIMRGGSPKECRP
jgi:hypothetical protein